MIRRRNGGRGRAFALAGGGTTRLRLTSMMDILVVLLLFLLKAFVADGEAMTPPAGVDLPESSSAAQAEESVVVAVVNRTVLVGGEAVATLDDAGEGRVLPGLRASLERALAQSDALAQRRGLEPVLRPATVQADRELPFRDLERVLSTLGAAGFEVVSLAVIRSS